MKCKKNIEKKKLLLFRDVIDSLLGLEDYLLERDGMLSKELAGKMEGLYGHTNDMMKQDFCEGNMVQLFEDVLAVLQKKDAKASAKVQQIIPPRVIGEKDDMTGETTLLRSPMRLPFLIRQSTKEKILINRDIFKIGKERSYVDYYVDNDAVSRSHADIIRQKDNFFVVDHNSLNHTFLEGKQIPSKQYVRLESGQSFLLANEAFTFYYEAINSQNFGKARLLT